MKASSAARGRLDGTRRRPRPSLISWCRSFRLTDEEDRVLRDATELLGQPRSQFVQAAVVDAAHRLGFYADVLALPKPYRGPWPDHPDRRGRTSSVRMTIVFDLYTADLLGRAASYVGASDVMFVLGATFRFLANLRRVDRRLRSLTLPPQYEKSAEQAAP